jgi:hypothetical protein
MQRRLFAMLRDAAHGAFEDTEIAFGRIGRHFTAHVFFAGELDRLMPEYQFGDVAVETAESSPVRYGPIWSSLGRHQR